MDAAQDRPAGTSSFGAWMGSMWLYTSLRFGLFGVLWAIFALIGLSVFAAALVGLVVSVPLSFVLLARPRARFAAQIEQRVSARRVEHDDLADQLDPDDVEPQLDAAAVARTAKAEARRRKQR